MNTPNGCADLTLDPRSKLDPPRLSPLSMNIQMNDLQESKNSMNLNPRKKSLNKSLRDSVIRHFLKLISKLFLYQSSAAAISGLGIYLIDYRGCIFTASVQFPHIIH